MTNHNWQNEFEENFLSIDKDKIKKHMNLKMKISQLNCINTGLLMSTLWIVYLTNKYG